MPKKKAPKQHTTFLADLNAFRLAELLETHFTDVDESATGSCITSRVNGCSVKTGWRPSSLPS
jgi:hypothetical protein